MEPSETVSAETVSTATRPAESEPAEFEPVEVEPEDSKRQSVEFLFVLEIICFCVFSIIEIALR